MQTNAWERLIEIMVSRNRRELEAIAAAYERTYRRRLDNDIRAITSGTFEKALIALLDKVCSGTVKRH